MLRRGLIPKIIMVDIWEKQNSGDPKDCKAYHTDTSTPVYQNNGSTDKLADGGLRVGLC